MDRDIPVASRLVFQQSFERSYLIHQHKMATYKPMIDNKPPPQVEFLRRRFEDVIKKAKVQRDNRILVHKIQAIFQHGHHLSLKKQIKRHADRFAMSPSGSTSRKHNFYEINKENQSMLNRLNSQTSPYNHKRFIKERQQVEKNISLISTFRVKKHPNKKTRMAGWFRDIMQGKKKSKVTMNCELPGEDDSVLFNKCQEICGRYYYVEVAIRAENFNINIENVDNDLDRYQLRIPKEQGIDLLNNMFEGSVQDMVDGIIVDGKHRQCYIECPKRNLRRTTEEPKPDETITHTENIPAVSPVLPAETKSPVEEAMEIRSLKRHASELLASTSQN